MQTSFVERKVRPGTVLFFRTQSPRHFEGGDWDQGGSCQRSQPLMPQQVCFSLEITPKFTVISLWHCY